jgi:lysophospholipase L1-like esterase
MPGVSPSQTQFGILMLLAVAAAVGLLVQGAAAICRPRQDCDWAQLAYYRQANAVLPAPSAANPRVVLMGDSITEGWPESRIGAEMGSLFPGKPYVNRGISGQTTPQMLVRFRQDVIALKPTAVVILAGTNDLAGNTGEETLEEIEGNLASMCELARANAIRVVLVSVLPAADYPWAPGRQPIPKIAALNQWLRDYAAANHHSYLDLFTPMATPAGAMRDGLHTGDGVHPSRAGYELMAPLMQKAIEETLGKS